jgi:hypothetical protein
MAELKAAHVELELDANEPISGQISASGGTTQGFRGWLELASLIERLRHGSDDLPIDS